jgi:hypothetical protein
MIDDKVSHSADALWRPELTRVDSMVTDSEVGRDEVAGSCSGPADRAAHRVRRYGALKAGRRDLLDAPERMRTCVAQGSNLTKYDKAIVAARATTNSTLRRLLERLAAHVLATSGLRGAMMPQTLPTPGSRSHIRAGHRPTPAPLFDCSSHLFDTTERPVDRIAAGSPSDREQSDDADPEDICRPHSRSQIRLRAYPTVVRSHPPTLC